MSALGWIALYVVVAIVAAIIASNKGRSGAGWFFLCIVLTPLAVLILLALPSLKPGEPQPVRMVEGATGETKICPQCAEPVKAAAKICRFCRYEFPVEPLGLLARIALEIERDPPSVEAKSTLRREINKLLDCPSYLVEIIDAEMYSAITHVLVRFGESCERNPSLPIASYIVRRSGNRGAILPERDLLRHVGECLTSEMERCSQSAAGPPSG